MPAPMAVSAASSSPDSCVPTIVEASSDCVCETNPAVGVACDARPRRLRRRRQGVAAEDAKAACRSAVSTVRVVGVGIPTVTVKPPGSRKTAVGRVAASKGGAAMALMRRELGELSKGTFRDKRDG